MLKVSLLISVGLLFLLAGGAAIPAAIHDGTRSEPLLQLRLSPRAQQEIRQLEARIDNTEAAKLADLNGSPDRAGRVALLGKLLLFNKTLSVNRNEACAFCVKGGVKVSHCGGAKGDHLSDSLASRSH